jgi:hypothetical protein
MVEQTLALAVQITFTLSPLLKAGPPNFDVRVFDVRDRTHWRRRSDSAMMPEASLIFSLQC